MTQEFIFDGSLALVLVTVTDGRTQMEQKGYFKFQCLLEPMQVIGQDALYRDLIGPRPHEADRFAARLAFALAQLKFRVVEGPEWWRKGKDDLWGTKCDFQVIQGVLDLSVEAEEIYLKRLSDSAEEARNAIGKKIDSGVLAEQLEVSPDVGDNEE
jgi:hypothetical protein